MFKQLMKQSQELEAAAQEPEKAGGVGAPIQPRQTAKQTVSTMNIVSKDTPNPSPTPPRRLFQTSRSFVRNLSFLRRDVYGSLVDELHLFNLGFLRGLGNNRFLINSV